MKFKVSIIVDSGKDNDKEKCIKLLKEGWESLVAFENAVGSILIDDAIPMKLDTIESLDD